MATGGGAVFNVLQCLPYNQLLLLYKKKAYQLEDGETAASKGLALISTGPEFIHRKAGMVASPCEPSAGQAETEGFQCSVAGQPGLIGELQERRAVSRVTDDIVEDGP